MVQTHNLPKESLWKIHYDRVIRWYNRITDLHFGKRKLEDIDYCYDEILVFFILCHHLKDWIINDSEIPSVEVQNFIEKDKYLRICADIANGTKHRELTRPKVKSQNDLYPRMHPAVSFDERSLSGGNEPRICFRVLISIDEEIEYEAHEVASKCLKSWKTFLCDKELLPQEECFQMETLNNPS